MAYGVISAGLQYGAYITELSLLVFLLRRGRWRGARAVFFYTAWFLAIDAISRPLVLYRYNQASREYAYFFWLSDVLLTLAAFLLICFFFRRACAREGRMWYFLRLMLVFVFVLILGKSYLSLSRNYSTLLSAFIIEFEQNLYFTCLVLNTLLYVLMQQIESTDEELGLLVCGMGIQYAGQAAGWALVHLTPGDHYAYAWWLQNFMGPLCTSGMFLTWFYALGRVPGKAPAREALREGPALAGAVGGEN